MLGILYGVKKYIYEKKDSDLKIVYLNHWQLSKWLIPSGIMQWSSINLYILAAAVVIGPISVGIIRLAQNIIGALNVILLAIENYLPTKFSFLLEEKGLKNLQLYVKKIVIYGVIGLTILGSILSIFSDELFVLLYGFSGSEFTITSTGSETKLQHPLSSATRTVKRPDSSTVMLCLSITGDHIYFE